MRETTKSILAIIFVIICLTLFISVCAGAEYSIGLDDPMLWQPAEEQGKVEKKIYQTHWYVGDTAHPFEKEMCVYLPPKYDANSQYDVMILLVGMDMPASCYLSRAHRYSTDLYSVQFSNVLDNAIAAGIIPPVILTTIQYYGATILGHPNMELDANQITHELRNDVLPYIISNYSTYARGTDSASISAEREHFAVFGFSYTSTIVIKALMGGECLDLFGWYGASSVFWSDLKSSAKIVNDLLDLYPVYSFYCGCGDKDDAYEQTMDMYSEWLELVPRLKSISNLVVLPNTGHDARTYDTAIYNCLTTFFRTE